MEWKIKITPEMQAKYRTREYHDQSMQLQQQQLQQQQLQQQQLQQKQQQLQQQQLQQQQLQQKQRQLQQQQLQQKQRQLQQQQQQLQQRQLQQQQQQLQEQQHQQQMVTSTGPATKKAKLPLRDVLEAKRLRFCLKCKNHDLMDPVLTSWTNHKMSCRWENCRCQKCTKTETRRRYNTDARDKQLGQAVRPPPPAYNSVHRSADGLVYGSYHDQVPVRPTATVTNAASWLNASIDSAAARPNASVASARGTVWPEGFVPAAADAAWSNASRATSADTAWSNASTATTVDAAWSNVSDAAASNASTASTVDAAWSNAYNAYNANAYNAAASNAYNAAASNAYNAAASNAYNAAASNAYNAAASNAYNAAASNAYNAAWQNAYNAAWQNACTATTADNAGWQNASNAGWQNASNTAWQNASNTAWSNGSSIDAWTKTYVPAPYVQHQPDYGSFYTNNVGWSGNQRTNLHVVPVQDEPLDLSVTTGQTQNRFAPRTTWGFAHSVLPTGRPNETIRTVSVIAHTVIDLTNDNETNTASAPQNHDQSAVHHANIIQFVEIKSEAGTSGYTLQTSATNCL